MNHPVFKTPKGTELPLLDLRGKPYLQVPHRLVWFREDHPDWLIECDPIERNDKFVTMKAKIYDETGRLRSAAHKTEHFGHFADALEKAETGAIGRALALIGYGTQFAPDVYEEDRIVDSPTAQARPAAHKFKEPISPPKEPKKSGKTLYDDTPIGTEGAVKLYQNISAKGLWTRDEITTYIKSVLKTENAKDLTWKKAKDFANLTDVRTFQELVRPT